MSGERPSKFGESFSEWFSWIIREAEIYDYGRYPVKGMGVWMPYGFQIRRRVIEIIRRLLDETGHEEILLPLLIPETLFKKESEHVRGFEAEVFWVTRAGLNELDVKLVLRPTSETALSYMESMWIKGYRQLPKKYYQIVSMFRYETKMTKPMIRVREVTMFKEAHTAHETFSDAERQVMEAVDIYRRFFDELGIPYLISKRPQWDKFAGAVYTIAFDTLLPDGRAMQIGTVHHLGQTFSSVFEVRIQRRDESLDFVWQTSYGISERVIASIIAFHSDERGLILMPKIAPIQVVVVPIPGRDEETTRRVREFAREVAKMVSDAGFRVRVDDREDMRPVEKYFYWELKGVPIRIEVGPRELGSGKVVVFRRDKLEKRQVELGNLAEFLRELARDIENTLRERAWSWFRERIKLATSLEEALKLAKEGCIVEIPWCGDERCLQRVVDEAEGIDVIGIPLPTIESREPPKDGSRCVVCGAQARWWARIGRKC
ncbi:MAG: proline--tRNA ligase [Crenarchaeota archaeon]|nr:proline--tRNA ligase [Thermoproteota archaeon]